jgi:error-prone DNA polymerase
MVRAHTAAKSCGMKLLVGTRLLFEDAPDLLVWAPDRKAYGNLCRLLTLGKRRAEKGECRLHIQDFVKHQEGLLVAVASRCAGHDDVCADLHEMLKDRLSLVVSRAYGQDDESHVLHLAELSRYFGIPLLATNGVHYHDPVRRALQDVLTCIRHTCTIHEAGLRLFANAERYLKSPQQIHRLFTEYPQAIHRGIEIAERCNFSMDELKYEYPDELVPDGQTPIEYLTNLTWTGAIERYPHGLPDKVRQQVEHELQLIEQLKFEAYFLTVYDLVRFARSRDILCQGRGSAANSAVCYCLGVTSVDPARIDLLFERFVSAARNEPPDIDIDFEHERREEVIQYLYQKYGRDRCGIAAEVITYRGRSAIRDVGKAMGLSLDMVDSLAKRLDWWHRGQLSPEMLREAGLDPADGNVRRIVALAGELLGFPRHLSQHVGGMVMTRTPLCELVPIENAAMEDRTVIEWDKDDIDELGILKVDVLALGMLTCIAKAFRLIEQETERRRDEETKWKENFDGQGEYISGLDCMAESDELPPDPTNASEGTIWPYQSNAPFRCVNSLEYCRRVWTTEQAGSDQVSSSGKGFAQRALNANSTGLRLEHADEHCTAHGGDCRSGSSAAGFDPQPGKKAFLNSPHSVSSSLCLSVSTSCRLELHTIPPEDPAVYDMICNADTVGVFQIESRAQMSMLPRLRPRCFYDLVIEVAIVRPGPIQGNMVHPYLRRRNGEEPVSYPSEALRQVLHKTLGVPLFQEQAMRVAMVGAGFTADEADKLRRAMAAWKKSGALEGFHQKIVQGMLKNGYTPEFAEQCFMQIRGFGEYGFPESHSASFALLVYVSSWIKCHHPAAFCAALLNSQPMGFYAPAQIVRDAREHGVEVRCVDVNHSDWDCTLEHSGPAVRLGFRQIKGFHIAHAQRIMQTRARIRQFTSIDHFHRTTGLPRHSIVRLAEADAFSSLGMTRREALWDVMALSDQHAPLFDQTQTKPIEANLPVMPLGQEVMTDYSTISLSLKRHPVSLVRDTLQCDRIITAQELQKTPAGRWVKVAGLVLIRQRPGTASGIVFITLEDETGVANLIVRPQVFDRFRAAARHAALLQCDGYVERQGQVIHVMARRLIDRSSLIRGFELSSRDFH